MTGAALVLSVVDARTGVSHRVAVEAAALHRHAGRYPALCGADVLTASLTAAPVQDCQGCLTRAQAGADADRHREPVRSRRPGLSWRPRTRHGLRGTRSRARWRHGADNNPNTREGPSR